MNDFEAATNPENTIRSLSKTLHSNQPRRRLLVGWWTDDLMGIGVKFPPNLCRAVSWRLSRQIFLPLSSDSDVTHRALILNLISKTRYRGNSIKLFILTPLKIKSTRSSCFPPKHLLPQPLIAKHCVSISISIYLITSTRPWIDRWLSDSDNGQPTPTIATLFNDDIEERWKFFH